MPEIEYVIALGEGARKRHGHKTIKKRVVDFVVQLEVQVGDKWKPVIRYDCAHGYTHIDRFYLDGKKVKSFINLNFNETLVLADEDIRENWEKYRDSFLKGE